MLVGIEILARLGRFDQDAATTMVAVLVTLALTAYWILRT